MATAKTLATRHSDAQTVIQVAMNALSPARNSTSTPQRTAQRGVESLRAVVATSRSARQRAAAAGEVATGAGCGRVTRCPTPPPRNASSSLAQPGLYGRSVTEPAACSTA